VLSVARRNRAIEIETGRSLRRLGVHRKKWRETLLRSRVVVLHSSIPPPPR
jgi:hypothetical protein